MACWRWQHPAPPRPPRPTHPKESQIDARLTALLGRLLDPEATAPSLPLFHAGRWLADDADPMARVAAAFLVAASGPAHPDHQRATDILADPPAAAADQAAFYRAGLERISSELGAVFEAEPGVADRWDAAIDALGAAATADEVAEAAWRALLPAGGRHPPSRERAHLGAPPRAHRRDRAGGQRPHHRPRARGAVHLQRAADGSGRVHRHRGVALPAPSCARPSVPLPPSPSATGSTTPSRSASNRRPTSCSTACAASMTPSMRSLVPSTCTCLLSVSVTHDGLAPIARRYVEAELAREGRLRHLDVVVVTEDDTRRLVDEVLLPALGAAGPDAAAGLHRVVGVDGRYGRHYTFLKAVGGTVARGHRPGRARHLQDRPRPGLPAGGPARRDRQDDVRAPVHAAVGRDRPRGRRPADSSWACWPARWSTSATSARACSRRTCPSPSDCLRSTSTSSSAASRRPSPRAPR